MFNPGQIQRNYQTTIPLIKNSTHLILDNIQSSSKSRWDQPIQIPPVLYRKFNVPIPNSIKQTKLYPKTLLDYIKRAYDKCKDDNQKLLMEKQLREIVRNFENDFNQVNWESYPLPNIQQDLQRQPLYKIQEKSVVQVHKSRLNEIRLPSSYNIVEQQKPSKAMEIAKKRMQKLQQKLKGDKKQQQQQAPKKQSFIGFSSVPPPEKTPRFQLNFPVPPLSTVPNKNSLNPSLSLSSIHKNPLQINSLTFKPPQISNNGLNNKQSIPPTILKYQTNEKPIQKLKQKQKQNERFKQKQKQKQKQRQKQKQKQRQKQKQKSLKQKQLGQKQKGNQKPKLLQVTVSTKKVTKKQLLLIQKLKQHDQHINQVARRFKDFNKLKSDNYQKDPLQEVDDQVDFEEVIVGKSQSIEKPYLRITGRPNPDTVRPEAVLKKALKYHLDKYEKDKNYEYLIGELRSIRQDLTVQHIKNGFTVQVYQQNLQISLYEKDIPQFKHCQTTLWQLYSQGLYHTHESRNKFIAHQMVTLILEDKSQQMQYMLTRIPEGSLETTQIQQCLKLKQQLIVGNYTAFFNYYCNQNKFIKSLLQLYIDKMTVKFLLMICKTCGQKVPIKTLCKLVGQSQNKVQKTIRNENGVIQGEYLMLKSSYQQFLKSQHLITKKVTILMG